MSRFFTRVLTKVGILIHQLVESISVAARLVKSPPSLIFVGDSHAHFIANNGAPLRRIAITSNDDLVIYLGSRLLYSVATKGFQFGFITTALLHLASKRQPIIFVLGEIDCRVHLVTKAMPLGQNAFDKIAANYVSNVLDMVSRFKFGIPILLSPVPPSDIGQSTNDYPRNGSILERISVTSSLSDALAKAAAQDFLFLDLSQVLIDNRGVLRPSFTDDGVHTNQSGAKLVLDWIHNASAQHLL